MRYRGWTGKYIRFKVKCNIIEIIKVIHAIMEIQKKEVIHSVCLGRGIIEEEKNMLSEDE